MPQRWSAEEMTFVRSEALRLLAAMPAPIAVAAAEPRFPTYYEEAAVSATFRPPADLTDLAHERLRHDATQLADDPSHWTLHPDVRMDVLRQLIADGRLLGKIAETESDDPLRRALSSFVWNVPPFEELALGELAAGLPFLALFPNVAPERVHRRLELLRILEPFRHLVQTTFRGREAELATLREYVGVTDRELTRKDPFFLFGLGGMGKSTLIGRLILEHALLPERERYPFAYIDLDRPVLEAEEPVSILREVVRQIGLQYDVAARAAEGLQAEWNDLYASRIRERGNRRKRIIRDFHSFIRTLELRGKPLLLVLDTFEELQYRSHRLVREMGDLLTKIGEDVPGLRTILVGRAEEKSIRLEYQMALGQLDPESAAAVLEAKAVPKEAAVRIAARLGGVPLTLHLFASLYAQEVRTPDDLDRLVEGLTSSSAFLAQGYLFRRILDHIHDDDARRIALPAMLLREITPGLIRHVLAKPAGIAVASDAQADTIFEALQAEVALVTTTGPQVLQIRSDVRLAVRGMLQQSPGLAREVHELAVAYYARSDDAPSRAEELHHRLALDQPAAVLDTRWRDDAAGLVESSLQDVPPRAKTYLASRLGLDLRDDEWVSAEDEVWVQVAARRAEELLRNGDYEAALHVLREREVGQRNPALLLLAAQAAVGLGRLEEAHDAATIGIAQFGEDSVPLLQLDAQVLAWMGERGAALGQLRRALDAARRSGDELEILNVLADFEPEPEVDEELRTRAFQVSPDKLRSLPSLFRRIVARLPEIDREAAEELIAERRREELPLERGSTFLHLSRSQKARARDFLLSLAPTREALRRLFSSDLDRSLDSTYLAADLDTMIWQIIKNAERAGWLAELLRTARRNAGREHLLLYDRIATTYSISTSGGSLSRAQIRDAIDESRDVFEARQSELGRAELQGRIFGTVWRAARSLYVSAARTIARGEPQLRFGVERIGSWLSEGRVFHGETMRIVGDLAIWNLGTLRREFVFRETISECLWLWHDVDGLHVSGVRGVREVDDTYLSIPITTPAIAAGALCVDRRLEPIGILVQPSRILQLSALPRLIEA